MWECSLKEARRWLEVVFLATRRVCACVCGFKIFEKLKDGEIGGRVNAARREEMGVSSLMKGERRGAETSRRQGIFSCS